MQILIGAFIGLLAWVLLRLLLMGVYRVDQNQRAVKTRFGRAVRVAGGKTTLDDPIAEYLRPEERPRYSYPQVRVIQPGGPYAAAPLPGPVQDTYGAGDCFAAGLTFALGRGDEPLEAAAFAARCGATVVTGRGPYERQLRVGE